MINKSKLEQILIDIHISDVLIDQRNMPRDSIFMYHNADLRQILKNYDVSLEDFKNTYNYYAHDPKELDLVYLDVIEQLSEMQARANK